MSRLLVDRGADLDTVDINGVPPIGYALSVGSTAISKLLLDNGCNIWLNEGEWQNSTILNFGLSIDPTNSKSMLSFLLSADLDEHEPRRFPALHANEVLNAVDRGQGNTVLHRAAANGDYESVFSLIAAGADMETKNNAGRTPLEEAERKLQDILPMIDKEMADQVTKLTRVITYMQL
jgi:ankyrin repeat protein